MPGLPRDIGLSVPLEPSLNRERLKTAFCLFAILAAVMASFRPGRILGDDAQYLNLAMGLFTGNPFQNLPQNDVSLVLSRPLGYPLLLSLFYPILGQHWEMYAYITSSFCFLLGVATFFFFHFRMGKGYALVFTLAMLCNPMLRFWSSNVYSDIPFIFCLVLFIYLYTTKRALQVLPILALFMVSLHISGLPLAIAYGVALAVRKETQRLAIFSGLLVIYFATQQWYFGEIPGIQAFFQINVQEGGSAQSLSQSQRMLNNLGSLLFSMLSATFFYGGYAWMPASLVKSFLCLIIGGAALFCLIIAAGRSVFINLFIAGYFALILMLQPGDLAHRTLIPLIPLAFLGAGRLAAVADGLYMPRVRQALIGVGLLAAIDGVASMRSYESGLHPLESPALYHADPIDPGQSGKFPTQSVFN